MTSQPNSEPQRLPLAVRLLWLIGPSLMLLASFTLKIGNDRAVILPIVQAKLPEMCTLYSQFGIDCPGCGLTRSFIHMSAGRIGEAWRLNPSGILIYVFVVIQIPIAALQFAPNKEAGRLKSSFISKCAWLNQWLFVALIISLPAQWIVRLVWKGLH